ncbi:MAG: hypothetical protein NZM25_02335 [Leptospiraceae bacterium]|nr:hypothetical protein [Leptospiraceae bacterium]
MDKSLKQPTDVDILNALAILQAKEAGLITEEFTNKQVGIYGAYESQLGEIIKRAEEKEIAKEEAKSQVQSEVKRLSVVEELVSKGYDALSEKAVEFVSKTAPTLTPLAKEVAEALREPTVNAVSDSIMQVAKETEVLDIVNAVSILKAKEAGLIREDLTNKQVGVHGAYKSDILQIAEKLVSNVISPQEAKEQVRKATKKVSIVDTIISKGYDFLTEGIARVVSKVAPVAGIVVRTVARVIKEPIVEAVSGFVKAVGSFVKSLVSIFG